jgi:2-polyprenyl-3-methyl-5-hydroxy-6-metoxy-1,4-benzoquinol methylase
MDEFKYFNNIRPEMLDFVPKDVARILEVGCGEGVFGGQLAQRQGAEVWGIEPNRAAAEIAAARLFRAENGPFDENVSAPRNHFDCVIFNDVLEHMPDPWAALELSKRFLRDQKSVVVASIPNFRYWHNMVEIVIRKDFSYSNAGILDRTHLRFFTRKTIIDLFAKAGFEILGMAGINPTPSRKFKLANFILMNRISDMEYLQYGLVARRLNGTAADA